MFNLYLDDERFPRTDKTWTIARSFDHARDLVLERGIPDYISFDHDLGKGKSGYDFAKWLMDYMSEQNLKLPARFKYNVHSANPVGVRNIVAIMDFARVHLSEDK